MIVQVDDNNTVEVYRNRIEENISEFCREFSIDNPKEMSMNQWASCMMYTGKRVFSNRDALKRPCNTPQGAYDLEKVNSIADFYFFLCGAYDKIPSVHAFASLLNIDDSLFYTWAQQDGTENQRLYQRFRALKEESLSNQLISSGRNPVGVIAVLNHEFSWDQSFVPEKPKKTLMSLEDIPRLNTLPDDGSRNEDDLIDDLPPYDPNEMID